MRVHHINKQNLEILNENSIFAVQQDFRIGHFIGETELALLPQDIREKMTISPSFNKRTISEDEGNPIVILPTAFKHNGIVKELIKQVYLVCNNEQFFINLGSTVDNGVETPNYLFFTPIEFLELTENDKIVIYGLRDENDNYVLDENNEPVNAGLIGLWNSEHPDMIITKPLIFANRSEFEQFKRTNQ